MAACSAGNTSHPTNNGTKSHNNESNGDMSVTCWQQRLFGKRLARCSSPDTQCASESIKDSEVIGVYFSFLEPGGGGCDEFTRHLVDLYSSVNEIRKGRFEVIHVLLQWCPISGIGIVAEVSQDGGDEVLNLLRAHVAELPWLAVPHDDYERKVRYYFGNQKLDCHWIFKTKVSLEILNEAGQNFTPIVFDSA
ncbi:hypothetical protein QAD02_016427 [Eretmocerus hayati]|uniref:Uncharacterized protein n=1 Tax=Eretmocerus hayati TaxID=131215 RepID=A0ACC2PFV5_9HYME|nr:hypothetical protein QAD02_016427 [Eretmocerus hayati]